MVEEAKKTEEKRTLEEVKLETDENGEIGTTAEVKETEITKEIKENDTKLKEEEVVKDEIENMKAEVVEDEKLSEFSEEELFEVRSLSFPTTTMPSSARVSHVPHVPCAILSFSSCPELYFSRPLEPMLSPTDSPR